MKNSVSRVLFIVACVIVFIGGVGYGAIWWYFTPKVPSPNSDVPVEYKIDWWPYQEALTLESLEVTPVFNGLNLSNNTAVVAYHMRGSLSYRETMRPYIKSVHLSERWEGTDEDGQPVASITLTPIVDRVNDASYHGEKVTFDLTIEDYLMTSAWGRNNYTVQCGDKSKLIVLTQSK